MMLLIVIKSVPANIGVLIANKIMGNQFQRQESKT